MHYLVSLIILTLAAAPTLLFGAPPAAKKDSTARRVLSYSEFVKEMVECTAAVYRLENAELKLVLPEDSNYSVDKGRGRYNTIYAYDGQGIIESKAPRFKILANVMLDDVECEAGTYLQNIEFQGGVIILKSSSKWDFRDCVFGQHLQNLSTGYVCLASVERLCFFRCTFVNGVYLSNMATKLLKFAECQIALEKEKYNDVFIVDSQIEQITLNNSKWVKLCLEKNSFKNFAMQNCTIAKEFAFSSAVQREIVIDSCRFDSVVAFYAAQLPHKNTSLAWQQIMSKNVMLKDTLYYRARTESEFADAANYNNLISVYTDFLSLYKTRGDQESYNACYVEMKQIHTRRAGFLYRQRPTLESWFDWRLNQLLEVFSDYGTNAAKGLIYVFYVIIGFAALYLIFPSEPDNLSRQTSFAFFDVVIGYFSTNTTLVNLRKHKRQRALDDLHNFQTTLAVSREDVPAFIAWLGKPLYGLNRAYLSASAWLVERFDIVPGRWQELSKGRKLWTSVAVGAYMLGFLLWGVVMRFVNAFALSINAFVTLGYGEIQARGVARYLAVLEGAVGWFLLSIFSVTLISQLLQ